MLAIPTADCAAQLDAHARLLRAAVGFAVVPPMSRSVSATSGRLTAPCCRSRPDGGLNAAAKHRVDVSRPARLQAAGRTSVQSEPLVAGGWTTKFLMCSGREEGDVPARAIVASGRGAAAVFISASASE